MHPPPPLTIDFPLLPPPTSWKSLSYLSSKLLDVELLATLIGPIVKQSDPNMSQEQQDPDMIEEEDEEALISGPLLVAKLQVSTHTSLVKRQHPD